MDKVLSTKLSIKFRILSCSHKIIIGSGSDKVYLLHLNLLI